MIKSSPETSIDANWLKTELLDSLEILSCCGFRVRTLVCDNLPSNESSFKKLLEHVNQNLDDLHMLHKPRKIYPCYEAVHFIKNVRNNLLKCKGLYSLRLNFLDLKIESMFLGGAIAWKTLPI